MNRLVRAESFTNFNPTSNTWGVNGQGKYLNTFEYACPEFSEIANSLSREFGRNIMKQTRANENNVVFDQLDYRYHLDGKNKKVNNRLYHVDDAITNLNLQSDDIEDFGDYSPLIPNQTTKYKYCLSRFFGNKEGRLILDEKEGILNIVWRVDGKVKEIVRKKPNTETGNKQNISFEYDAIACPDRHLSGGHRIAKHVFDEDKKLQYSTYYILDAQGKRKRMLSKTKPRQTLVRKWLGKKRMLSKTKPRQTLVRKWLGKKRMLSKTKKRQTLVRKFQGTMSVYKRSVNTTNQTTSYNQTERYIYGSSRLGVNTTVVPMQVPSVLFGPVVHKIGLKNYELSNLPIAIGMGNLNEHRFSIQGNLMRISPDWNVNGISGVLTVISDKPIAHPTSTSTTAMIDYWMADIRQATDYSPFGAQLYGRNLSASGSTEYRFGFQGQEEDDEIKSEGNSVNYRFRMHDPRLGRFFAVDPITSKFPYNSPYAFSENRVVDCVELEGLEVFFASSGEFLGITGHSRQIRVVPAKNVDVVKKYINWSKDPSEHGLKHKNYNLKQANKLSIAFHETDGFVAGAVATTIYKIWVEKDDRPGMTPDIPLVMMTGFISEPSHIAETGGAGSHSVNPYCRADNGVYHNDNFYDLLNTLVHERMHSEHVLAGKGKYSTNRWNHFECEKSAVNHWSYKYTTPTSKEHTLNALTAFLDLQLLYIKDMDKKSPEYKDYVSKYNENVTWFNDKLKQTRSTFP